MHFEYIKCKRGLRMEVSEVMEMLKKRRKVALNWQTTDSE